MRISNFYRHRHLVIARLQSYILLLCHLDTILIGIGQYHFCLLRNVCHTLHFQYIVHLGQFLAHRHLMYEIIFDTSRIIQVQGYWTPDTTGSQTDTPVPTIAIWSLTAINTHTNLAMVIVCRIVKAVGLPLRHPNLDRRMEIHLQTVFTFPKHLLHRKLITHKHIVGTFQQ